MTRLYADIIFISFFRVKVIAKKDSSFVKLLPPLKHASWPYLSHPHRTRRSICCTSCPMRLYEAAYDLSIVQIKIDR